MLLMVHNTRNVLETNKQIKAYDHIADLYFAQYVHMINRDVIVFYLTLSYRILFSFLSYSFSIFTFIDDNDNEEVKIYCSISLKTA
jgi:hypothetical protein